MSAFFLFVSNNALLSTLVGAAVLGAAGWASKWWHDRKDSQAVYSFLVGSKSQTGYTFRSKANIWLHPTAGSHTLAAAAQRGRCAA